jgi:hypothetical protein
VRRKWLATGISYSGRAALRREQCDVHAVCLRGRRVVGRKVTLTSTDRKSVMASDAMSEVRVVAELRSELVDLRESKETQLF